MLFDTVTLHLHVKHDLFNFLFNGMGRHFSPPPLFAIYLAFSLFSCRFSSVNYLLGSLFVYHTLVRSFTCLLSLNCITTE